MSETEVAVVSQQPMTNIDKMASKKFILVMFFSLSATIALFTDDLAGQEYLTAMGMLVGIYITGNVTQRIKGA